MVIPHINEEFRKIFKESLFFYVGGCMPCLRSGTSCSNSLLSFIYLLFFLQFIALGCFRWAMLDHVCPFSLSVGYEACSMGSS